MTKSNRLMSHSYIYIYNFWNHQLNYLAVDLYKQIHRHTQTYTFIETRNSSPRRNKITMRAFVCYIKIVVYIFISKTCGFIENDNYWYPFFFVQTKSPKIFIFVYIYASQTISTHFMCVFFFCHWLRGAAAVQNLSPSLSDHVPHI